MTRASWRELLVLAGKAVLLALYLLALLAGIRRHDAVQTLVLLVPVALGAAWTHRGRLAELARLDHPTTSPASVRTPDISDSPKEGAP